jgi:hypothetical protein
MSLHHDSLVIWFRFNIHKLKDQKSCFRRLMSRWRDTIFQLSIRRSSAWDKTLKLMNHERYLFALTLFWLFEMKSAGSKNNIRFVCVQQSIKVFPCWQKVGWEGIRRLAATFSSGSLRLRQQNRAPSAQETFKPILRLLRVSTVHGIHAKANEIHLRPAQHINLDFLLVKFADLNPKQMIVLWRQTNDARQAKSQVMLGLVRRLMLWYFVFGNLFVLTSYRRTGLVAKSLCLWLPHRAFNMEDLLSLKWADSPKLGDVLVPIISASVPTLIINFVESVKVQFSSRKKLKVVWSSCTSR